MDYLNKYSKNETANRVSKHQMGGDPTMGAPAAPAAPAGGEPDIEGMLAQFAQSQDPQLAVEICNALLSMMGGMQQAPEGAAPSMRNGGRVAVRNLAPVFDFNK